MSDDNQNKINQTDPDLPRESKPGEMAEKAEVEENTPEMESKKPQSDTLKVKSAEDTNSDDEPEEDEEASTKDSEPEDSIPADEETPAEDSQPEEQTAQDLSSTDIPGSKWYVVHTYSGHENRVANALKQRIESEHLENKILDILVPTQEKIEIRAGKKERVKEKIFPGYLMVKMILDDNSWLAVRTTPGVTSFVGIGNKPTPIPESEIKSIVTFMTQGAAPTFKDVFLPSDTVKIIDGPFADFIGKVDTVDKEKGKVRILVSIFGRETPVELDFLQITKL